MMIILQSSLYVSVQIQHPRIFQCKWNPKQCLLGKFLFFFNDLKISQKDPCTFLKIKEIISKRFTVSDVLYRFLLIPFYLQNSLLYSKAIQQIKTVLIWSDTLLLVLWTSIWVLLYTLAKVNKPQLSMN